MPDLIPGEIAKTALKKGVKLCATHIVHELAFAGAKLLASGAIRSTDGKTIIGGASLLDIFNEADASRKNTQRQNR